MRGMSRLVPVAVAVGTLAGCIGATPRDEFDAEVRARGGGLTAEFLTDSLDLVAVDVGGSGWAELDALSMAVDTGNRSVTVVARRIDRPDFVDTVTVVEGEIVRREPVQDAADLPLDDLAIPLGSVALDRIEEISAEALRTFGEPGGFVDRVSLTRAGPTVTLALDVESERRTASVAFDADGTLRGLL